MSTSKHIFRLDLPATREELTAWRLSVPAHAIGNYLGFMIECSEDALYVEYQSQSKRLADAFKAWITELTYTAADTVTWTSSRYEYNVIEVAVLDVMIGTADEYSDFYNVIKTRTKERVRRLCDLA
jgi:hypothetical protein